ncbi:MAG: FAD-dependent oxidoreductase [Janthinobacterium lividum]
MSTTAASVRAERYDVIVVGAGINGVGIARDAALRGLRVLLVEQDDICSGVSAWSGRLVHGGLRYLEQYDVKLVHESLAERERLFRQAPHLVRPIPLMIPMYTHNRRPGWMIELGMIAYDVLSWRKSPPWHRVLTARRTRARFPGAGQDGLRGSAVFYDGQVELAERLCVELAVDSVRHGATVRTHARVDSPVLEDGRVTGVEWVDQLDGGRGRALAPVVLNVAGPWIDNIFTASDGLPAQPRLNGGTKGSHLVVDAFPGAPTDVVYYESRRDGRLVLVIPWLGRYLIGTTDIRFDADPEEARCDIGELDYLLGEVNALVPQAHLTRDDVLYTYSGVRPLPYVPDQAESSVPRSHSLHDHAPDGLPGLVSVVGGKLTTFRSLAQDAVDEVYVRLGRPSPPCPTLDRPFPGAETADLGGVRAALVDAGAAAPVAARLVRVYGSRARDVWDLTQGDPGLARVLDEPSAVTVAEVRFAMRAELARTLTDVMARRTLLAFEPGHGLASVDEVAAVMAEELGWNEHRLTEELTGYRRWLDHLAVPSPDGPRSESFGAASTVGAA